ncbi:MAG: tellurite resistance TerB family protein [Pseudomonadales bacterium]|nr:tellurite resistance TerB family protein [Pseudomonadales bacterium]MCP5216457.1 tellurite resistance TerB family protein [Pseudomonadales bacterium]
MDARQLIDNLFNSGSEFLGNQSAAKTAGGQNNSISDFLSGKGGAALAGGALGLLLGNKKARKVGGTVAMYGGLAALGAIAYKAYGNWQRNQTDIPVHEPQTIDRLSGPQADKHSKAILRALIGAAKADGHIDDREQEMIGKEIAKLSDDVQLRQWFDQELRKPLDPAEVASSALSSEMAAEMYLASVVIVDKENYMERAYLQELARQLELDTALINELERQASHVL